MAGSAGGRGTAQSRWREGKNSRGWSVKGVARRGAVSSACGIRSVEGERCTAGEG